jgi:hypothetical protein
MNTSIAMKGREVLKLMRRTDKHSESSTDSAAHTQTLTQQKQLNGKNHHIPLNINTECYWPQCPYQNTSIGILDYKGRPGNVLFTRNPLHRQKQTLA